MVRPGCRGPGGEPNARALPILPGRGSYGMTSAASRKAALSRRRPRPRRHREGCRRVTARRNRPLDRELSCANRRRPCSSRPLRQTSSIRAGPTGRPACYPLFSSPGISSAFPEPGTKPTSTYASKLAAAESLLSDRSAAPPKTTIRRVAIEFPVQRLQIGDVVALPEQGSEVEATVAREIDRAELTVRVTLRVEGREDFIKEWPIGEMVTVIRGP